MTPQEIEQVNAYIAQLNASNTAQLFALQSKHNAEVQQFKLALQSDRHACKVAQQAELKMGEAMHQIWNLSIDRPTLAPAEFAVCVRQIINYYCPNFDVPF